MSQVPHETVHYRYPPRRLLGDYLRAGVGTAFCLFVLLAAEPMPFLLWLFLGLGGIFLAFGLYTARLQLTHVALNQEGIATHGLGRRQLAWEEIERLRLRYFGSRRQRKQGAGSLELTLWGRSGKLKFDGQVEGFRDIAWHALQAARRRDLPLDEATADNLASLGLDPERNPPRPPPDERSLGSL
ncbi:hypothetical protein [Aquibaculum sediminis]|uniref:hypothetical protein n=1 Tax=Aquibaculum sediminis TaxID=3231907 RepID=UPI003453BD38